MLYNKEQRQLMIWQQTKQADTFEGVRLLLNLESHKLCRAILRKLESSKIFIMFLKFIGRTLKTYKKQKVYDVTLTKNQIEMLQRLAEFGVKSDELLPIMQKTFHNQTPQISPKLRN